MNDKEILETVEESIATYCQKQRSRDSKKVFSIVIDNDKENKIVATGINSVLALIKKVLDFEMAAYSVQVDDPDNLKQILSLFDHGPGLQIVYSFNEDN